LIAQLTALKTTGIVLISLALVLSVDPYLLIFAIPIFCIGAVAMWLSKSSFVAKALWTVLPVLLWLPAIYIVFQVAEFFGKTRAQKLDFILPANYEGRAIVIEQMPCGQPVKVENGREQLFFPANGVLLYQGNLKSGYINNRYYQLQMNGQKKELEGNECPVYADIKKHQPTTRATVAWLMGNGKASGMNGINYSYTDLLITSNDSAGKYFEYRYTDKFDTADR
jgi:hypothetical protein